MENNFVKVKTLKLAGFLMMQGFVLLNVEQPTNQNRKLFIFHKTNELSKAMDKYATNKQKILDFFVA